MFRRTLSYLCSLGALSVVASLAVVSAQTAKEAETVGKENFAVYNAVLDEIQFPQGSTHVLLADDTLNFKCGADSGNPILFNGCSGMIVPPDTPEKIRRLLNDGFDKMGELTWSDFERKNMRSFKLQDSFVTAWKHMLVGPDIRADNSKEWDSPNCTFYFSSVGFNPEKTEAIVFVLLSSNMENVPSSGDYFLYRLDSAKKWNPNGRVQYFATGSEQN